MYRASSGMVLCITASAALTALRAPCAESIDAEAFAKRCAQGQGHLSIDTDLLVEGGVAEIGECRVTLGAVRLDFRGVEFAATGFFMIDGQPDGEILVERSLLTQSPAADPVNILLRAHRVAVRVARLDFLGTGHLETGAANRGRLRVESSVLRSTSGDIHLGSSGRGREGNTVVKNCELIAGPDGISVQASAIAPARAGRVQIEESYLASPGPILIQTGEDGRTGLHRNRGVSEWRVRGIYANALSILSGEGGVTTVNENRIIADEEAAITSGGETRVDGNDFVGSGDIIVSGPSCEARSNIPEVECSGQ